MIWKSIKKAEQLMFRTYPAIIAFPKAEKYCLSQTIKNTFFQLLTYLSLGNSVKSKKKNILARRRWIFTNLKNTIQISKISKIYRQGIS